MFDIIFYKNRSGKEPVLEYIQELSGRTDKDSHIKLQKVHDSINYLKTEGKKAG
jgi:phage-related protein